MAKKSSKKTKATKKRFEKIIQDIEEVKIQGARNIAQQAIIAYTLIPTKVSKKKLLSLRPTEPMLRNVLTLVDNYSIEKILEHFDNSHETIKQNSIQLIHDGDLIFTHCHSSSVVESLINAKKQYKKSFSVYNTETRPLFQGRKTANELKKAGIKTTMFVDSAINVALSKEQNTKKPDKVFLGADALLKKGIVNKIGSEIVCKTAKENNIPVYIFADSWKFSKTSVQLEQRSWKEVWKSHKKTTNLRIENPAFEFVPKKYITGIVSELGVMGYDQFLKTVKKISKTKGFPYLET